MKVYKTEKGTMSAITGVVEEYINNNPQASAYNSRRSK